MTTTNYDIHQACLVCGSNKIERLPNFQKGYLTKCQNCSFIFSERIPTLEELIAHYNTYGRNDYLSPITVKRYHEILDFLEPYRKTNNLIDVGCGIGHFLTVAKERGWNVYGTEFTDEAIQICEKKGISMHQGVLNPKNYPSNHFDVIVSFEVLEHINNPQEEVANFNAILRNGGAVYLTTPNFNAVSRLILKEKWAIIEYPEHLCYYTPKTLTRIFKQFGFDKKWIQTTGINFSRFETRMQEKNLSSKKTRPKNNKDASGKNIPIANENSKDEQLRKKIEHSILLKIVKASLNGILNTAKTGDSMKGLFIKK
jgi:2-polyprenyl-3-methyl-5-hydroxy-6-metoxy-1,4-benzoquinol methylase